MKRILKKNQIIITTLAIMIAVAEYLNFSGNRWMLGVEDLASATGGNAQGQTDVAAGNEAVSDQAAADDQALLDLSEEDLAASGEIFTDEVAPDADTSDVPGEAVLTSAGSTSGITAQVKVNREQVRSKNKEMLLEIINNSNIEDAQKQDAIDAMVALTDKAEREAAAEMLLEAKGFADVVVNIEDDTADVVVGSADLGDAERAQIEDIMKRKTGVSAENIVITPLSE